MLCVFRSQVLKALLTTCKDSNNEEHGSSDSRAELQCLRVLCLNDTSPLQVQHLVYKLNCTEIALFYPPLYLLPTSSSRTCNDSPNRTSLLAFVFLKLSLDSLWCVVDDTLDDLAGCPPEKR